MHTSTHTLARSNFVCESSGRANTSGLLKLLSLNDSSSFKLALSSGLEEKIECLKSADTVCVLGWNGARRQACMQREAYGTQDYAGAVKRGRLGGRGKETGRSARPCMARQSRQADTYIHQITTVFVVCSCK
jgi:hypothetical protein